jgi:transposase
MKKMMITLDEYEVAKQAAAKNKDKHINRKLQVILLRYKGLSNGAIAEKLDYEYQRIAILVREFKDFGIDEFIRNKHGGNHRHLTAEEEAQFLKQFVETAEKGLLVTQKEMARKLEEHPKLQGKKIHKSYVSRLLDRHNWRKVVPRPQHPKKADKEAIEASKKLTPKPKSSVSKF